MACGRKIALVSGDARGIGFATAKVLVENGAPRCDRVQNIAA